MRKVSYLLSALALCFMTSCSSDQPGFIPDVEPSAKTQVISIDIKGVEEFSETRPSGLRALSLTDAGVKHLHYFVYNESDGAFVKQKHLYGADILNLKDTLPEGNYRIALMGTTFEEKNHEQYYEYSGYNGSSRAIAEDTYSTAYFVLFGGHKNIDFFFNDLVLKVENSSKSMDVILSRITSKIEIVPQDVNSAPASLDHISFFIDGPAHQYFRLKTREADFATNSYSKGMFLTEDISKQQLLQVNDTNPITSVLFATEKKTNYPLKVVQGSDLDNSFIIKQSYTLERNKILRLKGSLFTSDIESGEITIDNEWDSEVIEESFD